jgi:hypothetical protein
MYVIFPPITRVSHSVMQYLTILRDWWGNHTHVYCREIVSERERKPWGVLDKLWGITKRDRRYAQFSAHSEV